MKIEVIIVVLLSATSCFGSIADIFEPRPAAHDMYITITPRYSLNISQCCNVLLMGLSATVLTLIHKRPSVYVEDHDDYDLLDYDHIDIIPWTIVGIIGLYKTLNAEKINPIKRTNSDHDEKTTDYSAKH